MSRKLWAGAGALAILAVAVGLALRPGADPVAASRAVPEATASGTALASLGEQKVDADELKALFAQLPVQARQQLRNDRSALETWIRARLAEKALYQQAEAKGWSKRPDVEAQTRAATEQIVLRSYLNSVTEVPKDFPSDDELKQAYENGKAGFQVPALYRVSQIFLAVPDEGALESVRKQAQSLAKRAQASDADFAELARSYSQDAGSNNRGGDTGLQPLNQLLPEVRGTVAKMKVGNVSEPLQSSLGLHIIKLTELLPARVATFDEMRGQLRDALRAQRQEQAAKAYVENMFNTASLTIDGKVLNQVIEAEK
ncbi:peptidylprolyl isomerase [Pseudomonas putida]|uniref:PpiC domain-containing protein n=1 Tax=Pseudomonas putida TaxID=303 RepID=A0A1Q9R4D9_PSEPU|nr:peptidylprolyl isomerase [Pseudomonas putida]OLS62286.1 hypothetical protein PSEMO_27500 [Pseudomonas putida]